ncbi:U-scoloptoxin(16)-Ssd1a-like [Penaeus monodon]|uniref:U-scoloptoxin(16)-Ssd1a-like n=1 Tax=Penaeus monodon TaxID=6687 RepID=UPI0018A76963|nr:U-scoloptoxin(16)-Ssd1a-like [Penaeus monodon]WKV34893.1 Vago transcript isoform 2 [Penaeus monodon]
MASLLRVLLFLAVVASSFAAVQRGKAILHPDYPGRCFVPSIGAAFPPGSSWQVTERCAQRTCFEQDGDLYFEETGCGVPIPSDSCKVVSDDSQPHPKCCPRLACN